jgi:hypothetical protein
MNHMGEVNVYFWEQGWMIGYVCERIHLSAHEV